VQATTKSGRAEYAPLTGDGKWPSEPLYEQLREGEAMRREAADVEDYYSRWRPSHRISLQRGVDFDDVVLGIPVGALPFVTSDLADASPRWARMLSVETVATAALQLWVNRSVAALGGALGQRSKQTTLIGFAEPFDTWADMTHMLRYEDWTPSAVANMTTAQDIAATAPATSQADVPISLAYFCGPLDESAEAASGTPIPAPLSDHGYPERALSRLRAQAIEWVDKRLPRLWPAVSREPHGVWPLLVRTGSAAADDHAAVLASQYVRANVNPAERYVLSSPGKIGGTRLHPARSPFANLWLAGDWTLSGVNSGCAEAAITSGMLVARGLVGEPRDTKYTDYFYQFGPPVA